MCIINDNVAEELKLVGTSTLQVQDWGPGPTTGPADTLSDIWNDINEIEAEQYPSELDFLNAGRHHVVHTAHPEVPDDQEGRGAGGEDLA